MKQIFVPYSEINEILELVYVGVSNISTPTDGIIHLKTNRAKDNDELIYTFEESKGINLLNFLKEYHFFIYKSGVDAGKSMERHSLSDKMMELFFN